MTKETSAGIPYAMHISIAPDEYVLIWLDEDGSQGPLHANFKLSADGEYIGIYDNDESGNLLIDGVDFTEQQTDVSYGRLPNGTGNFELLYPTPGNMNQLGLAIPKAGKPDNYHIYPNPTNYLLYIEADQTPSEDFQVVLMNIYGQEVLREEGRNSVVLDLSLFPGGIYVLGIHSAAGFSILEKVVRE